MSKVKIQGNASGTGTLTISAPATNTDRSLTLPDGAGEILTDASTLSSSNLSGALPALDGSALTGLAGGFYESYAIICDEKANGTHAGASSATTWHTRDLNTELYDADGIVSISSNQFTLGAGTYTIEAMCPAYYCNGNIVALYSVTDTSYVEYGVAHHTGSNVTYASLNYTFTITSSKTYEIRQYIEYGYTNGLGVGYFTPSGATNIFTTVKIWKHA